MAELTIFGTTRFRNVNLHRRDEADPVDGPSKGWLSLKVKTKDDGEHEVTLFSEDIMTLADDLNTELTCEIARREVEIKKERAKKELAHD
jgi:hypothetical protein